MKINSVKKVEFDVKVDRINSIASAYSDDESIKKLTSILNSSYMLECNVDDKLVSIISDTVRRNTKAGLSPKENIEKLAFDLCLVLDKL